MENKLHITLEMEGFPSEEGHISLGDFQAQLRSLTGALKAVDKSFDSERRETLYYRVVKLSHDRLTRVTVMPVQKKKISRGAPTDPLEMHDFFFQQLKAIRENRQVHGSLSNEDLEAFRELAEPTGKTISKKFLHNSSVSVNLDEALEKLVVKLILQEKRSQGTLQGTLERINLHGRNSFSIYPQVGPKSVFCDFSQDLREKVKRYLDKEVRVRGTKFYRPSSNHPHRMRVTEITEIDDSKLASLLDMKGVAPYTTGETSSEEFISHIRAEWSNGEES